MYLCLALMFTLSGLTHRKKCMLEPPESFSGSVTQGGLASIQLVTPYLKILPAITRVLKEVEMEMGALMHRACSLKLTCSSLAF